jgi:hypothetical protein
MAAFLRSPEGAPYRAKLPGIPGTQEFSAAYAVVALTESDAFAAAQKAFIVRTHYIPLRNVVAKLGCFSLDNRGVQEALYSMSVQHAGAVKIVAQAAKILPNNAGVAQQIEALYRARAGYVSELRNMPSVTRASLLKRYRSEVKLALEASLLTA